MTTPPKSRKPWPWPLEFLGNALGVVVLCAVVAGEIIANRLKQIGEHNDPNDDDSDT